MSARMTRSRASAATSSPSCSTAAAPPRSRRWRAGSERPSRCRSRRAAGRSCWRQASGWPSADRAARSPTTCSATPNPRCTAPRRRVGAGASSSTTACAPRCSLGSRRSRACGPRSTAMSCACSTSPCVPSRPVPPSAWRRSHAGSTRRVACSCPTSSFLLRRRRGSSFKSVSSSCVRPASR